MPDLVHTDRTFGDISRATTDGEEPMSEAKAPHSRLIRWPEVHDLTGIPKSTAYDYLAAGTFPVPVKLSARSVAWKLSDVLAWIESRQSARPAKAA